MGNGRFCCRCLMFRRLDEGHEDGELFFCGPEGNSLCRWEYHKERARLRSFRNEALEVLRYDIYMQANAKWYVRCVGVDWGYYANRDTAIRSAWAAAHTAIESGHDAS